jgi:tetratricopeptide (TPR) repeat protein
MRSLEIEKMRTRISLLATVVFAGLTGIVLAQGPALPAGTTSVDNTAKASPATANGKTDLTAQAEDAIMRGEMQKALTLLDSSLAITPNNARALYDRGYVEQSLQHTDAAIADFQKAIVVDPKQYEAYAALGRLFASQGKLASARTQLEAATTLTPADLHPAQTKADDFRLLARVDEHLHDPAAATNALIAALKLTPEQPEDTLLAAQLAEQQGDRTGAEAEYRKALTTIPANGPESVEAVSGLTRILVHERKFDEAETLLRQALEQQPQDPTLLAQQATVLAGEGKTAGAIADLETLHQTNPSQSAITRMLADLYTQEGEAAKADPLYMQLLAQGRPDADLLTARGENLIRQQRYAEAVATLQKAVALQADLPDTWSDLAFAASEDKQYALVLQALGHRANYKPEVPATLFLRATALDHLHQTQQAILYYRQFIQAVQDKFPDKFPTEVWQAQQRLAVLTK